MEKEKKQLHTSKVRRTFVIFLAVSLLARLINFRHALYFIWDQGRDAWVLDRMAGGDLVLVGPTSGLSGFFLGPFWYYVGLIGRILGGGDPYLISLWYMLVAALALPIFWLLAHKLFPKNPRWAVVAATVLSLIPGSILGTTFIWNPLLSIPLVAGLFWCLLESRHKAWPLWLAAFLLGLILQSEFAYGIFFAAPLLVMIPWIRGAQTWRERGRDYILSSLAFVITLAPQLLFELRNQWFMTRSLLSHLNEPGTTVGFDHLLRYRPQHFFWATSELLFGQGRHAEFFLWLTLPLFVWALWSIWRRSRSWSADARYAWQLTSLLAAIPYVFFLFWRGNYGNFFSYYLAPHFIFLIPLLILGVRELPRQSLARWGVPATLQEVGKLWLGIIAGVALIFAYNTTIKPLNEGGLFGMESAISTLYSWRSADKIEQGVFLFFTANSQTEHYDYLMHWIARKTHQSVPLTAHSKDDHVWYLLLEKDSLPPEKHLIPWYREATAGGILVRRAQKGPMRLETWATPARAAELGLSEVPSRSLIDGL